MCSNPKLDDLQAYIVGGYVRDTLLGIPPQDRDWVVLNETPKSMIERGFIQVGQSFPVFLHPETREEYALARTEKKSSIGYSGFTTDTNGVSLEEDLKRRDLTINAMALAGDKLIDPYQGAKDIENKTLRHISPAFSEDPLRVLRTARFQSSLPSFTVAPETEAFIKDMKELDSLTGERVWLETVKSLHTPRPSIFFRKLEQWGHIETVFPELANLRGIPQPPKYHQEGDVWEHTLQVLDTAASLTKDCDKTKVLFACLCHDLGKALSPHEELPHHYGHESRGLPLVEHLSSRLKVPKNIRNFALLVTSNHGLTPIIFQLKVPTLLKLLKRFRQPEDVELFSLASQADGLGRIPQQDWSNQTAYLKQAYTILKQINYQSLPHKNADTIRRYQIKQLRALLAPVTHPKHETPQ